MATMQETGLTCPRDRSLAQVVRVSSVYPIEGADRIEVARVLGWEVVVQKGLFKVDDLAVYFSIGSVLDQSNPENAFLEGKPLKTKKIRGVISQGLLGPLSWLAFYGLDPACFKEGDDVSDQMKVQKWVPAEETEVYSLDKNRAPFPMHVPKTDEERVQNMTSQLSKLEGRNVVVTQKSDGTSTTFVCLNNKFMICGRNNTLLKEASDTTHYFEIATRYGLQDSLPKLGRNIALQGEIIGPKINGNRHKVSSIEYYVFNVYDIDSNSYLSYDEVLKITTQLGLKTVSLVYKGLMKPEWLSVKALLQLADEQKYDGGHCAEGVVLKTDDGIGHPRTSCKVISNAYLLKYKL